MLHGRKKSTTESVRDARKTTDDLKTDVETDEIVEDTNNVEMAETQIISKSLFSAHLS